MRHLFQIENNLYKKNSVLHPFQAWFYIVIFIHYKPRIAVAILDL